MYPTKIQQAKLWKHANLLNRLYNYFLKQRLEAFEKNEPRIYRYQQQAELVQLKKDIPEIKEIHAQVLQQVPLRLDNAYTAFLKRIKLKQGKPCYRSCHNFFGITYPQSGYKITKTSLCTKAYGKIKLFQHRGVIGEIKQIKIICKNEKWFVCVTTDHRLPTSTSGSRMIGLDLGIANLVATSEGEIIPNRSHARYFNKQINKLRSHQDKKCKKNSRRHKFLSRSISKLYGAKVRKTNDFLHKVSRRLTLKYDTIVIEDLTLKKMSESNIRGLNRELRNSCLARFIYYLSYKAERLIKVNPMNTSKMCNRCGRIHDMPLSKRTLVCECGNVVDRDVNAAQNILCLGRAYLLNLIDSTAILTQEVLAQFTNPSFMKYNLKVG
jgi:putative transposase